MPLLCLISAALSFLLAAAGLISRELRHRLLLAAGFALLGLERLASGWSEVAVLPSDVLNREFVRFIATALLPGVWLFFSRSYGRARLERLRPRDFLPAVSGSALALLLLLLPVGQFFADPPDLDILAQRWIIPLGIRGYLFHVVLIVSFTMVVANLERTLRASFGRVRWQIKFAVLGLGGFFAVRIYTATHAVLYRIWPTDLDRLQAWALIAAVLLTAVALRRGGLFKIDIYVSQSALRGSITILGVGGYLIAVGVIAHFLRALGWASEIGDAVIFVAVVAVLAVLLSDSAKQDLRRWTRTHFRRPSHEYRFIWTQFNRGTAGTFDEREIARTVIRIVSDTLECLSVSLWAADGGGQRLRLLASTGTRPEPEQPPQFGDGNGIAGFGLQESGGEAKSRQLGGENQEPSSYAFPLRVKDELVGVLTLGDRLRGKPLSFEDRELLEVLTEQAATFLMNIRLGKRLQEVSEMEAFQHMSAFVLHDLKNLASRLSLTVQNFPRHYDNPEFRQEALKTMTQSVEKIRGLCSRLALIREKPQMHLRPGNLTSLVNQVLTELRPQIGDSVESRLDPVPPVRLDNDQFKKVVVNLVLNAVEATEVSGGFEGNGKRETGSEKREAQARTIEPGTRNQEPGTQITVTTSAHGGHAVLEVRDRGCGMTREFIEERLFHPFQTTKPQGMGIGLFQSRMIVEQHGGRIEVESQPGKGTTFRVLLPLAGH